MWLSLRLWLILRLLRNLRLRLDGSLRLRLDRGLSAGHRVTTCVAESGIVGELSAAISTEFHSFIDFRLLLE